MKMGQLAIQAMTKGPQRSKLFWIFPKYGSAHRENLTHYGSNKAMIILGRLYNETFNPPLVLPLKIKGGAGRRKIKNTKEIDL
jgi:hypothetical protein